MSDKVVCYHWDHCDCELHMRECDEFIAELNRIQERTQERLDRYVRQ